MQIKNAIQQGKSLIGGTQVENLALEVLLSSVIGKQREYIFAHPEDEVDQKAADIFISHVRAHVDGKPIAQLINKKEFFGIDFFVDERVLIPRPETEHLVEFVLEKAPKIAFDVIDIGTGSCNIAVSVAKRLKNARVTATDVSAGALEVAKINVEKHGLEKRIELIRSDLLSDVEQQEFMFIIANLPYIGTTVHNYVSKEADKFEPHIALYGGNNGLELYRTLFEQIKDENTAFKYLIGEIGFTHKDDLQALAKVSFPNHKCEVFYDLAGLPRYFVIECI